MFMPSTPSLLIPSPPRSSPVLSVRRQDHPLARQEDQQRRNRNGSSFRNDPDTVAALRTAVESAQDALTNMEKDNPRLFGQERDNNNNNNSETNNKSGPLSHVTTLHLEKGNRKDIWTIGAALGEGGYCRVHKLLHRPGNINDDSDNDESLQSLSPTPKKFYALKRLKPSITSACLPNELRYGIMDLAIEAAFLANLSHPHIIRLHGITKAAADDFVTVVRQDTNDGNNNTSTTSLMTRLHHQHHQQQHPLPFAPQSYGLVLEYLDETLSHRIERWASTPFRYQYRRSNSFGNPNNNTSGGFGGHLQPRNNHTNNNNNKGVLQRSKSLSVPKQQSNTTGTTHRWLVWPPHARQQHRRAVLDRAKVLLPIAKALAYLHSLGCMFRDLKPDNIGFVLDNNNNNTDRIVLFDFGMATTASERKDPSGSRRYMAPEAARAGVRYNHQVDVYAFGIVLWQVCSLKKPYADLDKEHHYIHVVLGGVRPKLEGWWPKSLQNLLRRCWDENATERPDMKQVVRLLESVVKKNGEE